MWKVIKFRWWLVNRNTPCIFVLFSLQTVVTLLPWRGSAFSECLSSYTFVWSFAAVFRGLPQSRGGCFFKVLGLTRPKIKPPTPRTHKERTPNPLDWQRREIIREGCAKRWEAIRNPKKNLSRELAEFSWPSFCLCKPLLPRVTDLDRWRRKWKSTVFGFL